MNAHSLLAHLFHPGSNEAQAAAELLEAEQLIRLTPTLTADELPPEFEEILEVQVFGYRERLTSLHGGGRQRVLDPVWNACSQGQIARPATARPVLSALDGCSSRPTCPLSDSSFGNSRGRFSALT